MKYTFNRSDEKSISGFTSEEVKEERWGWEVIYNDGRSLKQFDDAGIFHQFREIKTEEVDVFSMYKLGDESKRLSLIIRPEYQFFHFYRNVVLDVGTDNERKFRVYCFGWKDRNDGKMIYYFILPDDSIIATPEDKLNLAGLL